MAMDPNFEVNIYDPRYLDDDSEAKQTQMEREIRNRKDQTNKEFARRMFRLLQKAKEYGLNSLSLEEKRFFKARFEYLNKADRQEFGKVLTMDLSHEVQGDDPSVPLNPNTPTLPEDYDLMQKSRGQLNKMAQEKGVLNPEKLPGKQAVIDAMAAIEAGAEKPERNPGDGDEDDE